jgi:hypothetical protein
LLWFVPLDWHDPLSLQVDSLSFHLVQSLPVTSVMPEAKRTLPKNTGQYKRQTLCVNRGLITK